MTTIEILSHGAPANADISQYVTNPPDHWGDVRLAVNTGTDTADLVAVMDQLAHPVNIFTRRVIYTTAEVLHPQLDGAALDNLRAYDAVYSTKPVNLPHATTALPFQAHMVNSNHGTFNRPHARTLAALLHATPAKPHALSMIVSDKHPARFEFAAGLKARLPFLHWYGNGHNPLAEKWDGLAPYRYSIAIENHVAPNVITEKLTDGFATLTHVLYLGAPNAADYFEPHAFTPIPADVDQAARVIAERINTTPAQWPLVNARTQALITNNPFKRLADIARAAMAEPMRLREIGPVMW
jgi:hypothetical protein